MMRRVRTQSGDIAVHLLPPASAKRRSELRGDREALQDTGDIVDAPVGHFPGPVAYALHALSCRSLEAASGTHYSELRSTNLIRLCRASGAISIMDLYGALPSTLGCIFLPPETRPSASTMASLLWHTALRDWSSVADDLREIALDANEQEPQFSSSMIGRAAAQWNFAVLQQIREGNHTAGLEGLLKRMIKVQGRYYGTNKSLTQFATVPCEEERWMLFSGLPIFRRPGLRQVYVEEAEMIIASSVRKAAEQSAALSASAAGSKPSSVTAIVDPCYIPGVAKRLEGSLPPPPGSDVERMKQPPAWHAVRAVAAPAVATAAAAYGGYRLYKALPRPGKVLAAGCLVGASAAATAVATGWTALHRRISGRAGGNVD